MTRNNWLFLATVAGVGATLGIIKVAQSHGAAEPAPPIVLYLPLPHPYCTEVGQGGTAYARDSGVPVRVVVGQESTQANVNTNIESLLTVGHRAFAIYPVDPAGSEGLFARLHQAGANTVAYGAQPAEGSQVSFAVATDTKRAATLAAETLITLLNQHGNILDVLEGSTDANTPLRRAAVEAVVARFPGVQIVQTVGDVTTEQKAREKIESALVARGNEIDGIICTGYTTTVAAAVLLAAHNRETTHPIRFVGLDTDDRVMAAIRDGYIDATVAQNPFGHGYLSCALLDLLRQGWRPRAVYQFIDSGCMVVTRANVDSFRARIQNSTTEIAGELRSRYLSPPVAR